MPSPTASETYGLNPSDRTLLQIRSGCQASFEHLLAQWEPVIHSKAETFATPGADESDFKQVGRVALFRAAMTYRPGAAQFNTYATTVIVRAMIDEQRRHEDEAVSSDMDEAEVEAVSYDDPIVAGELTAAIDRWRRTLSAQHRQVITLLFYADLKQAAVARRLRVTSARVSQIVRDIRRAARDYELD